MPSAWSWGGGLSAVLAAVLHNASSVAVVVNSSRLIRYQLVDGGPTMSEVDTRSHE
jgi:cation-transporting P-type ATPase C